MNAQIVLSVALLGLVAWLIILTVQIRRLHQLYGQPVYRVLPDGRLRFTWLISQKFLACRRDYDRQATVDLCQADTTVPIVVPGRSR